VRVATAFLRMRRAAFLDKLACHWRDTTAFRLARRDSAAMRMIKITMQSAGGASATNAGELAFLVCASVRVLARVRGRRFSQGKVSCV
jgi:hypothetical protein